MKHLKFSVILAIAVFISCQTGEKLTFNGETIIVDYPKQIDTLKGSAVTLEGEYTGIMHAYGGLLVLISEKHPDGFLYLYDSKTGKRLKAIGKRGEGPNEFVTLDFLGSFEQRANDICLWINDLHRNNILLINTQGDTVEMINTARFKSTNSYGIGAFYVLNDSLLLAYEQPYERFENDISSPSWHVFNYKTGTTVETHKPYGDYRSSGEWSGLFPSPDVLLASYGAIKPDKSKLAQIMFYLKRTDILDLKSNKSKSIAMKDAPALNRITVSGQKEEFYRNLQCDDHYIYVLEHDGKRTSGLINVFDWDGNFARMLRINDDTFNFTFDPIHKILYSKTDNEKITAYDLKFLYK